MTDLRTRGRSGLLVFSIFPNGPWFFARVNRLAFGALTAAGTRIAAAAAGAFGRLCRRGYCRAATAEAACSMRAATAVGCDT